MIVDVLGLDGPVGGCPVGSSVVGSALELSRLHLACNVIVSPGLLGEAGDVFDFQLALVSGRSIQVEVTGIVSGEDDVVCMVLLVELTKLEISQVLKQDAGTLLVI